ncbi:MAG: hypothetical protein GY739_01035, partial [Mesoflavibacter sp.]|nr:hypothetical protein [Mesoflavibacter sp.]
FEFPGKTDIRGLFKSIRATPYMVGRMRLLEELMRLINEKEKATNQRSGAIVVFDLDGLQISDGNFEIAKLSK